MAPADREPSLDECVARLDRARNRIAADLAATRAAADVASRARASMKTHAWRWIAGAGLAGLVLARFGFRGKKRGARAVAPAPERPPKSALAATIAILVPIVQPAVVAFAKRAAAEWVARHPRK